MPSCRQGPCCSLKFILCIGLFLLTHIVIVIITPLSLQNILYFSKIVCPMCVFQNKYIPAEARNLSLYDIERYTAMKILLMNSFISQIYMSVGLGRQNIVILFWK